MRGCGGSMVGMWWLNGGMWWLNEGMWWLNGRGCGGSMVVHQTVKPAVPGSNPASLQPAGTCHFLLGSHQGWHETAGWPLRGDRGKKIQKYQKRKKTGTGLTKHTDPFNALKDDLQRILICFQIISKEVG